MLTTKHLTLDIAQIPDTWIFTIYCKLPEFLTGEEVRIRSLFSENDRRPSLYIFYSKKFHKYWFHDFSSGKSGDAIKLVQEIFKCSYGQACSKIIKEYQLFMLQGKCIPASTTVPKKYTVVKYKKRHWTHLDANFWTPYNISSDLLRQYYVFPLEYYVMSNKNDSSDTFTVAGDYLYGYFTKNDDLYKIYTPKRPSCKFIKVQDHLQGIDQLSGKKCLILNSSLKDGISLKSLNLDLDFIAPDSESAILDKDLVDSFLQLYNGKVFAMFDNDETGMKAMKLYLDKFGIQPIYLPLKKDLSDSIESLGPTKVLFRIVPLIDQKLCTYPLAV